MEEKVRLQRIRMLSALGDFALALSASTFLSEASKDERYNKIELRRFRCFEHTAIVSYARPFSQSKGIMPKLSLRQSGVKLTSSERELHERVIRLRQKVVAHSDLEMMNFASLAEQTAEIDGTPFFALLMEYDEGLHFIDLFDQLAFSDLIRKVQTGLYHKLLELAQSDPKAFDLKVHFPKT